MDKENKDQDKQKTVKDNSQEDRPRKGLEDWEMMQPREEAPLKIPYWVPILVLGLFGFAILMNLPFMGVREGYERPWFDSGIVVGIAYGLFGLLVIYFFMRKKPKSKDDSKDDSGDNN